MSDYRMRVLARRLAAGDPRAAEALDREGRRDPQLAVALGVNPYPLIPALEDELVMTYDGVEPRVVWPWQAKPGDTCEFWVSFLLRQLCPRHSIEELLGDWATARKGHLVESTVPELDSIYGEADASRWLAIAQQYSLSLPFSVPEALLTIEDPA